MNRQNKSIITNFIEEIWNNEQFDKVSNYIHPDFKSNALPATVTPDVHGLILWIKGTSASFVHKTVIDAMVCEEDKVMIKITMQLKHTGIWRGIAPTYKDVQATGYRYYILTEGKIISDWALIDGNAIENQLRETAHGCKAQE